LRRVQRIEEWRGLKAEKKLLTRYAKRPKGKRRQRHSVPKTGNGYQILSFTWTREPPSLAKRHFIKRSSPTMGKDRGGGGKKIGPHKRGEKIDGEGERVQREGWGFLSRSRRGLIP